MHDIFDRYAELRAISLPRSTGTPAYAGLGLGAPERAARRADRDRHPQLACRRDFVLQRIGAGRTAHQHRGAQERGRQSAARLERTSDTPSHRLVECRALAVHCDGSGASVGTRIFSGRPADCTGGIPMDLAGWRGASIAAFWLSVGEGRSPKASRYSLAKRRGGLRNCSRSAAAVTLTAGSPDSRTSRARRSRIALAKAIGE